MKSTFEILYFLYRREEGFPTEDVVDKQGKVPNNRNFACFAVEKLFRSHEFMLLMQFLVHGNRKTVRILDVSHKVDLRGFVGIKLTFCFGVFMIKCLN